MTHHTALTPATATATATADEFLRTDLDEALAAMGPLSALTPEPVGPELLFYTETRTLLLTPQGWVSEDLADGADPVPQEAWAVLPGLMSHDSWEHPTRDIYPDMAASELWAMGAMTRRTECVDTWGTAQAVAQHLGVSDSEARAHFDLGATHTPLGQWDSAVAALGAYFYEGARYPVGTWILMAWDGEAVKAVMYQG
jgi:hypothetical protein